MASLAVRKGLLAIMVSASVGVTACSGTTSSTTAPPATAGPGSTTTSGPTATAPGSPAPAATPAPGASTSAGGVTGAKCPTAAAVGAGLGVTVSAPVQIRGKASVPLPAGATGLACDYRGSSLNVLVEIVSGIDPSHIADWSAKFPVPYKSASGVGDQARTFLQALNGGKDNEGVVATKGTTLVDIVATATPATLSQVEALAASLL